MLGPFFFLSYGFANSVTSQRTYVPVVVMGWERWVPFLPWTIVPYWTSDLLYAASLLVCTTRRELTMHVKRLVAAQVISVTCFLAFPLRLIFERPETHGFFGWLFDVLLGFDKPFNQAPSLHVSLAVILWSRFSAHLEGFWRVAMGGWLILVVLSTMTTYQHQFLDLPTGALAGCLAIALFPEKFVGRPVAFRGLSQRDAQRMRLATFYLSGAVLAAAVAFKIEGLAWILLWPAAATLVVAIGYAADWPGMFQPVLDPSDRGALHRRRLDQFPLVDALARGGAGNCGWRLVGTRAGIFEGSTDFGSIVNLAAELQVHGRRVPMLDLVTPSAQQLEAAVAAIEDLALQRPTLVCCALGYLRSASAVAAWMVATGRAASTPEALAMIRGNSGRTSS